MDGGGGIDASLARVIMLHIILLPCSLMMPSFLGMQNVARCLVLYVYYFPLHDKNLNPFHYIITYLGCMHNTT